MDKNQIIGISLLTLIMFGWFWLMQPEKKNNPNQTNVTADTTNNSVQSYTTEKNLLANPLINNQPQEKRDSFLEVITHSTTLQFCHYGGTLTKAVLNNFKQSHDTSQHVFFTYNSNWYNIDAIQGANDNLYFELINNRLVTDDMREVSLQATHQGNTLQHIFRIYIKENRIEWIIKASDYNYWFSRDKIPFSYSASLFPSEQALKYEQQMGNISYNSFEDEYDFIRFSPTMEEEIDENLKWISYKQRFFNTTLISTQNKTLSDVFIKGVSQIEFYKKVFANITTTFNVDKPHNNDNISFAMYIGENDYATLAKLPYPNMNEIVDYGSGFFAFVKYINRGLILPFFSWITSYVERMGWAIALLTIFIRLLTSPLLYSSYLSSAKMKVLRPELAALKAKVGDDKQKYSMEQMNLFRQAGVNPLGGCIPALLQIPIFFALYSFFNSHIQLRGESFLWATDLSTYDTIFNLPFNIPFYGSHVSLFNITATITSFFISLFGMSMNSASSEMANNPAIKYMPYIFPFFLLFIFNSMPAALTWYYTISNIITLGIQVIINRFIIDHDKIMAQIELKKKKAKNKPSLQQKLERFQKARKQKQ